ncbi:MAG: TAXI family TRAP transporter solute-binding subunit [Alphaproteobacteria bacterium]|nr:TAXI family TRAP transporter solute-binding subunit [Alphaproteobacteria bacterium]
MRWFRSLDGWSALFASVCLMLFLEASAVAQPAERQVYDLGTATTDGMSHPLGVTIAALIKLKLLPQANIDIDAKNTAGSRANALSLRNAELDFAILTNLDAHDAARGTESSADEGADPGLRHVTNLWTSAYHFVVRNEYAPTGTFVDFLNLRGRRVALGEDGSDLQNHARAMFAALDVDLDEAYQLKDIGGRSAVEAFLNGELDGFLLVDERDGADVVAFLEEAGEQAAVLTVGNDHFEAIQDGGAPVWTRIAIPANSLPGQTREHVTIGMRHLLCSSERVAEGAVYQITKTIFDNLPFLREMHSATVGISLETALEQLFHPVHAGAATYYREVGITVPEPEPVRISTLSQTAFLSRFSSVQDARARLNESTITLLGGAAGQTITRMTSELAASLAESGIRVVGMTSPGPANNLADVLYARGVDNAVVPLDILSYALEQNVYPGLGGKIAYATELFTEEVHLLASNSIEDIDDLRDQPVNLGPRDSASAFTASFLLDRLNIPVEPIYHDQRTALTLLEKGELAAVFLISGKPMPLLSEVAADTDLQLLEVPPLEGDAYRRAALSAVDYPNLLAPGDVVETFSVRTALISYNWRPDNPRYRVLSTFIDAFFDRLATLQQQNAGYHPKWRDIDPASEIQGWRRSPAAQSWIDNQGRPASERTTSTGG